MPKDNDFDAALFEVGLATNECVVFANDDFCHFVQDTSPFDDEQEAGNGERLEEYQCTCHMETE